MWKKYRIGLLSILLLNILLVGCAKKPATIKGTITDEDGNPLAGAAVFSVPQRYSTLSDTLGQFAIDGVESGQYPLLAKLGDDSTMINIGLVEPGQVLVTTIDDNDNPVFERGYQPAFKQYSIGTAVKAD